MTVSPWRIAAAKAIGTSHAANGTPCQDAVEHRLLETPFGAVLIAVVCDGAGSAAYSEIGSSLSAAVFAETAEAYFRSGGQPADLSRDTVSAWCEKVAWSLDAVASAAGNPLREYACTLLAAMISEHGSAYVQIGDGAIVVSEGADDGWAWVFWPQHGEFANTTNFIVSSNATVVMEFAASTNRVEEVAVFSDGIENLVLHHATKTAHAPFFESMMTPVRAGEPGLNVELSSSLELFLNSQRVCDRTDDDKSLVLASRRLSALVSSTCAPSD